MDTIELCMDNFIRLEYAWSSIQNSVDAAMSALRGIFSLMANGSGNPSSGGSDIGILSSTLVRVRIRGQQLAQPAQPHLPQRQCRLQHHQARLLALAHAAPAATA